MPQRIEPVEYPDGYQVRAVRTTGEISFRGQLHKLDKAFKGRRVAVIETTQDGIYTINYRHEPIRTINLTQ